MLMAYLAVVNCIHGCVHGWYDRMCYDNSTALNSFAPPLLSNGDRVISYIMAEGSKPYPWLCAIVEWYDRMIMSR